MPTLQLNFDILILARFITFYYNFYQLASLAVSKLSILGAIAFCVRFDEVKDLARQATEYSFDSGGYGCPLSKLLLICAKIKQV